MITPDEVNLQSMTPIDVKQVGISAFTKFFSKGEKRISKVLKNNQICRQITSDTIDSKGYGRALWRVKFFPPITCDTGSKTHERFSKNRQEDPDL
jgi:hypothetical protein